MMTNNLSTAIWEYPIVTYFRGNLISRKWNGHISRDLIFAISSKIR